MGFVSSRQSVVNVPLALSIPDCCYAFAVSFRMRWVSRTWRMKVQKMKIMLQSHGQILIHHRHLGRIIQLWL